MKKLHLLEAGENLETIVKIDSMPEYKVINPSEDEKEEAQKGKEASLPPEVTDNPKTDTDSSKKDVPSDKPVKKDPTNATKDLVVKLLDDIKSYLQSI